MWKANCSVPLANKVIWTGLSDIGFIVRFWAYSRISRLAYYDFFSNKVKNVTKLNDYPFVNYIVKFNIVYNTSNSNLFEFDKFGFISLI